MTPFPRPFRYRISCPVYQGATYDASTTNLTYRIDDLDARHPPVDLIISFLSPITPTSTLRQSIPASYVTVHVVGAVDLSVYIDLNGQWVSGDWESLLRWDLDLLAVHRHGRPVNLKKWRVQRQTELLLSEIRDRAEWGTLHFTAPSVCVFFPVSLFVPLALGRSTRNPAQD